MTTVGEAVSRVRGIFKAVKENAFLTDRFIYSIILKYGKTIISRQSNERKILGNSSLFEPLPFVEMIEVDKIEADCAGLAIGCIIMRTEKKLPKIFHNRRGPLISKVFSIDTSEEFYMTTPATYISMQKSSNFKYNKTKYYWFKNGYLYTPTYTEAIAIEALWEDPLDGFCNLNDTDCTIMQDKPFNIPDDLFAEIEQMAENEMLTSGKLPSDNMDDKQNILR